MNRFFLKTLCLLVLLTAPLTVTTVWAQKKQKTPAEDLQRIELVSNDAIIAYFLTGEVRGRALVNPGDLTDGAEVTLRDGTIVSGSFKEWYSGLSEEPAPITIRFVAPLAENEPIDITISTGKGGDYDPEKGTMEVFSFTVEHIDNARK